MTPTKEVRRERSKVFVTVIVLVTLISGQVLAATPIFVRTDGDNIICSGEVDAPVGGFVGTGQPCALATINQGVSAVDVGGVVNVAAGTYVENVVLNKRLTLSGAGSDPAGTIISAPTATAIWNNAGINFEAGGDSALDRLVVRDLRVTAAYHGLMTNSIVSFITIQDVVSTANYSQGFEIHNGGVVTDLELVRVDLINNANIGFKIAGVLDGLDVTDGHIDGNLYGLYFSTSVPVVNVTFDGTTFNDNTHRGMYILNLSNAVFQNITVSGNGNASAEGYGIDLNSRSSANANIQIIDSTITNNGKGNASEGAGIMITARLSGGGELDGVLLDGVTITDNQFGVLIGERGLVDPNDYDPGPTNVVLRDCTIEANIDWALSNLTQSQVDASGTWWGSEDPVVIAGNIEGDAVILEILCEDPPTTRVSVGGVCPPPEPTATPTPTSTVTQTPTLPPDPVPACAASPLLSCQQPGAEARSKLVIRKHASSSRSRVRWQLNKGPEITQPQLGDPTLMTSYAFCAYDESAGVPSLIFSAGAQARTWCGNRPCWTAFRRPSSRAIRYSDREASSNGLRKLQVVFGAEGKSRALVKLGGEDIPMPTLPLQQDSTITAQVLNSLGECWEATFDAPADVNGGDKFLDQND